MEDLKIFISEKLTLNSQSQLSNQPKIEKLYLNSKDKLSIKYNDVKIIFVGITYDSNYSEETICTILKTIEIIINNVNFAGVMKILDSYTRVKISVYAKDYDSYHQEDSFLGNILIDKKYIYNKKSLTGIGVAWVRRSPIVYSHYGGIDGDYMDILDDFIQQGNKKFKTN